LTGTRVLVGRARHQAGKLSAELRRFGASVIEIPFIEIRKPKSFQPLDTAVKNFNKYDWLILTSVNGVEALWERMARLRVGTGQLSHLKVATIGPATKQAIEQENVRVDVVPREYIAESVVRSLRRRIRGKRVLLVRAKVARDVIPRELRKAGAEVDVVEAYETVVPKTSRSRLQALLQDPAKRPHWITFTSSSTVKNFVRLAGEMRRLPGVAVGPESAGRTMRFASIGPVTSATLREFGLPVDVEAKQFTIPGLVQAIVKASGIADPRKKRKK
jgi:uroporphyrinogen-III synthase